MTIVSVSLPDKLVKSMDELKDKVGYSGRSDLVRSGIRLLIEEAKEKDALRGEVNAILIVTHDQRDEGAVTATKHAFEGIIKTHLHSKTTSSGCVELFLLRGQAEEAVQMSRAFQSQDQMKSTKLMLV